LAAAIAITMVKIAVAVAVTISIIGVASNRANDVPAAVLSDLKSARPPDTSLRTRPTIVQSKSI